MTLASVAPFTASPTADGPDRKRVARDIQESSDSDGPVRPLFAAPSTRDSTDEDEQEQEDPRRHPDEFVHFLDQYKKQKLEKSGHSKGESLQAKAAKAYQQLAATEYRLNSLGVDLDEVA